MDNKSFEGQKLVVQHASNNKMLTYIVGRRRERDDRDRDRYRDRGDRRDDSYGGRPYVKKRGPQEDDICHNCGKTGHW